MLMKCWGGERQPGTLCFLSAGSWHSAEPTIWHIQRCRPPSDQRRSPRAPLLRLPACFHFTQGEFPSPNIYYITTSNPPDAAPSRLLTTQTLPEDTPGHLYTYYCYYYLLIHSADQSIVGSVKCQKIVKDEVRGTLQHPKIFSLGRKKTNWCRKASHFCLENTKRTIIIIIIDYQNYWGRIFCDFWLIK